MKTKFANKYLKAQNRNREEGFTLIELLIVMSLIVILMVLAVPQGLKLKKSTDELSAKNSLQTIFKAQLQYSSDYPTNGFSCSLAALGGDPKSGTPTAQAAQLLPPDLAGGNKSGYTFNISDCTKVTNNNQDQINGYKATAVPNTVGKTGDKGFCIDENGMLSQDPAGGTNCTQQVQ
ncbi:MAG: type II secretion system GspH family protein [Acidobacteriaceae bacterium]|nr:type II secretion system GspH family protein [Acidobacteriaceae bacterium]